jgi:amidophosphoribosyltransferase
MGGLCGVISKEDAVSDLFFGTDYHSHLGTHRGGMAVLGPGGFQRSIHNIQNAPFRSKFEHDVTHFAGTSASASSPIPTRSRS